VSVGDGNLGPVIAVYADLVRYRELFGNLFRRDVQAKYRGSLLGVAWTLANPVLLMAVYLLVFSVLLKTQFGSQGHYALFLLVGLSAWIFFATAVQSSSRSLLDNANLIRKTRFPRQLVPLSVVATQLISFAVMIVGLLVLDFALLPRVRATEWLALPLALGIVALTAGLALAIACLDVLFRDIEFLVAALLLPLFFLTPVLYPLDSGTISSHHKVVAVIHWGNPLAPGIEALRAALFYGRLPRVADVVYLAVAGVAALALGAFVFRRVDDQLAVEV
jgi:ABC-type polysaccharide/polyol phosphate export permease